MNNHGCNHNKKIRLLHVIRPADGGMKGHLLSLAEGLRKRSFEVEIACPPDTTVAVEACACGFKVHKIDLVGPLNPGEDLKCIRQLTVLIRNGRYDIIHFHGSKAGLVGRIAAVLAGFSKTVLTVHNFIVYEEVPLVKKILFKYGERVLSGATSKIITVSSALKDDLVTNYKINGKKIEPVYNGIDIQKYLGDTVETQCAKDYGIITGRPVVGTVARMAPQKGLAYLISSSPEIIKATGALIVIAGDGPLRLELEKQVQDLGLTGDIIFTGYIEDIAGLLKCFSVFVIPSISEGLSITTIEAMASSLPVVASKVGGLPELVQEGVNGFLVPPRDPKKIAGAVIRLLNDPHTAKTMGQRGRQYAVENFSNENMIHKTALIYQQLLK